MTWTKLLRYVLNCEIKHLYNRQPLLVYNFNAGMRTGDNVYTGTLKQLARALWRVDLFLNLFIRI